MSLKTNTFAILNDYCPIELKQREGERVFILDKNDHKYRVEFDNGDVETINDEGLNELTNEDERYMEYIYSKNEMFANNEKVTIIKVDYLNRIAEVVFEDNSITTVGFNVLKPISEDEFITNYFVDKGLEIGKLVTQKQIAYGDSISKAYKLMQVYLENYDNGNDTYTIPKSLLKHILLQVRIIDKQNRIFSNPDGDLMSENPYADTVGYGLLGMKMAEEINE